MKKTLSFQITIAPDNSHDNPGLKLFSLFLDNQGITGDALHRSTFGPVERSVFDLFDLVSEHDDWARINCAKSIDELFAMLDKKSERDQDGKLTYARTGLGGEIEIKTYTKCLPGLRIEGEVRYDQGRVDDVISHEITKDLEPLPAMKNHCDGAHCGLADWYPDIEKGIQEALNSGEPFTTGWYGSKKEIASANVTGDGKTILVEASVSNDFDTPGDRRIPHTTDLETVRSAIYEAWDDAEKDQKDNAPVLMLIIGKAGEDGKRVNWCETYLVDCDPWCAGLSDTPPGDYYHKWGWQEETDEIPQEVRRELEKKIHSLPARVGDWIMEESS